MDQTRIQQHRDDVYEVARHEPNVEKELRVLQLLIVDLINTLSSSYENYRDKESESEVSKIE